VRHAALGGAARGARRRGVAQPTGSAGHHLTAKGVRESLVVPSPSWPSRL
jgi:hypothetical protein